MLRKMFNILAIGLLVLPLFSPAIVSANTSTQGGKISTNSYYDEKTGLMVVEETYIITEEQFIQSVAKSEDISYSEAQSFVYDSHPKQAKDSVSQYSYVTKTATYTYPSNSSFKATIIGNFEVYSSGSFRQINNCVVGSQLAAGAYTCNWYQTTANAGTGYPKTKASVSATGYYEVLKSTSAGLSGFGLSGSVGGQKRFVSNPHSLSLTYSVY